MKLVTNATRSLGTGAGAPPGPASHFGYTLLATVHNFGPQFMPRPCDLFFHFPVL